MKEIPTLTRMQLRRFESKIRKTDTCWLWIGSLSTTGYGQVNINHEIFKVHQVAYFIYKNKQPELHILHSCNNKRCVNPSHLSEGTAKENLQYASICRRLVRPKGEKHHCAKLTNEQVVEIKQRGLVEKISKLALEFSVSECRISLILSGKERVHG